MFVESIPFTAVLSKIIDNRGRTCPTTDTGLPLIATNCIRNELLYPAFEKVRYVSKETYATWFRGHPEPGDLIFVCKGSPGRVCMTPSPVSFCIAQDMVGVRANPRVIYPRYLFAVLRSAPVQTQIENMHVGTLIPHFKKGDFDKLMLPVPGRKTQQIIGDIYFEMSAKIESNRRMNATLEALARALFQSWFVDFDPVRAKLDGRQPPGLDSTTAALFPDRFQESRFGPIPIGWTLGQVEDALVLQRGFDLPASGRTEGPYLVMAASGPSGSHDEFRAIGPGVTTGRSGLLGKVFFVHDNFWPLNTALWVREFRRASPIYAYHLLRGLGLEAFNVGSAVPSLNRNHVHRLPLVLAPKPIVDAFESVALALMRQQEANENQSRTLVALRDTLLPKLLNGELRVGDATKQAEAVL